jgi:hypothetical protein
MPPLDCSTAALLIAPTALRFHLCGEEDGQQLGELVHRPAREHIAVVALSRPLYVTTWIKAARGQGKVPQRRL